MTVAELIRALSAASPDARVEVCASLDSGVEIPASLDTVEVAPAVVTLVALERPELGERRPG